MSRRIALLIFAALSLGSVPARAHHSFAAEFDATKQGELTGKVTGVWFNNPHVRVRIAAEQPDGTTEEWELQATSVTTMQQAGWTAQTLKVGDEITVSGQLGRNGAKKLFLRSVERPDGTRLMTGRDDRGAPDPNVVQGGPEQEVWIRSGSQRLPRRHHRPMDQPLQVPSDGRRSRAEADAVHGGRSTNLRGDDALAGPRAEVSCARVTAALRGSIQHGDRRCRHALRDRARRAQHCRAASGWTGARRAAESAGQLARFFGRPLGGRRARDRDNAPLRRAGWTVPGCRCPARARDSSSGTRSETIGLRWTAR